MHLKRHRPDPPARPALQPSDFPQLQRAGEGVAATAQRLLTRWVKATLLLTVLAAAMGPIEHAWAGWIAAVSFAIALMLGVVALRRDIEARWYDARALAETVKSMSWKYAVGSSDYPKNGADEPTVQLHFEERLATLLPALVTLDALPPPEPASHDEIRALRQAPLATRADAYLNGRLLDQQRWYTASAMHHRAWARLWQTAGIVLQVLGVVGAVLKGLDKTHIDWLGVAAAAAAATTAWLQTKDHVTLSRAYSVTAYELTLAAAHRPAADPSISATDAEQRWAAYVDDTEEAISREHNMWLGRRREPELM